MLNLCFDFKFNVLDKATAHSGTSHAAPVPGRGSRLRPRRVSGRAGAKQRASCRGAAPAGAGARGGGAARAWVAPAGAAAAGDDLGNDAAAAHHDAVVLAARAPARGGRVGAALGAASGTQALLIAALMEGGRCKRCNYASIAVGAGRPVHVGVGDVGGILPAQEKGRVATSYLGGRGLQ